MKYAYLIGASTFLIPWSICFFARKDLRKEMLYTGVFISTFGVFAEYIWYSVDFWHPETITGTRIGIEDVILGFAVGGVTAVIYKELFHKKYINTLLLLTAIGY